MTAERCERRVVLAVKVPVAVRDSLNRLAFLSGKTRSRLTMEILESHLNGLGYTHKPDIQTERSERPKR